MRSARTVHLPPSHLILTSPGSVVFSEQRPDGLRRHCLAAQRPLPRLRLHPQDRDQGAPNRLPVCADDSQPAPARQLSSDRGRDCGLSAVGARALREDAQRDQPVRTSPRSSGPAAATAAAATAERPAVGGGGRGVARESQSRGLAYEGRPEPENIRRIALRHSRSQEVWTCREGRHARDDHARGECGLFCP